VLGSLHISSKFNGDGAFLRELFEAGRVAAGRLNGILVEAD
jgi:hypothetical protein